MPDSAPSPGAFVVMGVCGTGKSTVGRQLAAALGWTYLDADDLHPAANVTKMRGGTPLTDADRAPWLDRMRDLLTEHAERGTGVVLACSALKAAYRRRLAPDAYPPRWVFLHGTRALLAERMNARTDHFMPPTLLDSQLAALEPPTPEEALWCDVAQPPEAIVRHILASRSDHL